jgi:hypothetical protein
MFISKQVDRKRLAFVRKPNNASSSRGVGIYIYILSLWCIPAAFGSKLSLTDLRKFRAMGSGKCIVELCAAAIFSRLG